MKIIHTSDIHLASPLTKRISSTRVRERKRELIATFRSTVDEALRLGAVGVDVGHTVRSGLDLQHELGTKLDHGKIVSVEILIDIGCRELALHKEGCHAEGLRTCGIVSESARVGDHTGVKGLCCERGDDPSTFLRQSSEPEQILS